MPSHVTLSWWAILGLIALAIMCGDILARISKRYKWADKVNEWNKRKGR